MHEVLKSEDVNVEKKVLDIDVSDRELSSAELAKLTSPLDHPVFSRVFPFGCSR
jgi:hypothetical protein